VIFHVSCTPRGRPPQAERGAFGFLWLCSCRFGSGFLAASRHCLLYSHGLPLPLLQLAPFDSLGKFPLACGELFLALLDALHPGPQVPHPPFGERVFKTLPALFTKIRPSIISWRKNVLSPAATFAMLAFWNVVQTGEISADGALCHCRPRPEKCSDKCPVRLEPS